MNKNRQLRVYLEDLAIQYETEEFLKDDPSFFMHQVCGKENQEVMAFIASCLSYGSRKQFFPKIQFILEKSKYEPYLWVKTGAFHQDIPALQKCYYRLYTYARLNHFLQLLQQLLIEYGSIGSFVERNSCTGYEAITHICSYFSKDLSTPLIPKNTQSACKRVCMFLRWMVRPHSPVDLGLWSHFINPNSLIIPLDTHVLQQANLLGLLHTKTGSMKTAIALTEALKEYFPNDPTKADFALFGVGVNKK